LQGNLEKVSGYYAYLECYMGKFYLINS
jgi:hypothetical protein